MRTRRNEFVAEIKGGKWSKNKEQEKIECVGFTCKISIILILVSNTMTSFVTDVEYFSD